MSTAIEIAIVERLHQLDEQRQAVVLDFVEYLARKAKVTATANDWPQIDPARDLAQFIGVATGFPEDGVAYQRQIRDTEWP
jgi:hypothetical protein